MLAATFTLLQCFIVRHVVTKGTKLHSHAASGREKFYFHLNNVVSHSSITCLKRLHYKMTENAD